MLFDHFSKFVRFVLRFLPSPDSGYCSNFIQNLYVSSSTSSRFSTVSTVLLGYLKVQNFMKPTNSVAYALNRTPWIKPEKKYHKGMLGLHEEIEDFCHWISPTSAEQCMRGELMQRITEVISEKFPNAVVDYFGSYRTGLFLPSSDIDIVLLGEWSHFPLHSVKEELVKAGMCSQESVKVLDRASVPIIKLTDQKTDVKIDVSFNMTSGLNTAQLVKSFIDQYPCLPKLVLVLKQFLQQQGLNESFTGGIGSYALVLLTVSFLQLHPAYDRLDEEVNLGVLLVEFLELYGRYFNFLDTAIRIKDGGSYVCKEEMFKNVPASAVPRAPVFSIEDPLQPGNDVGRTSYAAPQVKQAFECAYYQLYAATVSPDCNADENMDPAPEQTSILGRIIQVSDELHSYRARTEREYGHFIATRRRPYSLVVKSPPRGFRSYRIQSSGPGRPDTSRSNGITYKSRTNSANTYSAPATKQVPPAIAAYLPTKTQSNKPTTIIDGRTPSSTPTEMSAAARAKSPVKAQVKTREPQQPPPATVTSRNLVSAAQPTERCESKDPSDRRSLPENPSLPVNHQVSPSESQSPSQDTVYHERSFRQQHQGKSRSRGGWDATADYYNGRNGRTRWFGPSHRHSDFNMYQNHPGGIFPRKSASEIIREFEKRAEEQEAVAAGKSVTSASTSV